MAAGGGLSFTWRSKGVAFVHSLAADDEPIIIKNLHKHGVCYLKDKITQIGTFRTTEFLQDSSSSKSLNFNKDEVYELR